MVTAKKIAEILGLSQTAVSMALNNKPGVSEATRKLVLETAEKYGYDFSRLEFKKDQYTIGIIFFVSTNTIFSQKEITNDLLDGLLQKCYEENIKTKVIYYHENLNDINDQLSDLRMMKLDGLIVIGTEMNTNNCRNFQSLRLPMVVLDSFFTGVKCESVLMNNREGAYQACTYLIAKYLVQPGHLRSSYSINNFTERRSGFRQCVMDHGFSLANGLDYYLPPNIDGAFEEFEKIIQSGKPLARCYFADNDLIAIGAIKALKKNGYRVPKDIAVIGFDNTKEGELIDPPLTSVNVSRNAMARMSIDILMNIIRKPRHYTYKTAISTELVIRKSA